MLSQPPSIYILLSGVIAAVISSIFSIINNQWTSWVNNKFQLEREKQQNIRQLEREDKQRIWEEKSDLRKWYREKVYASYTKAIQILTEIIKQRVNEENGDINSPKLSMIKLFIEFDSEYIMIIRSHPDKGSNNFEKIISEIDKSIKEEPWIARDKLIEIMEQDSRIKPVNNNIVFSKTSDVRVGYIMTPTANGENESEKLK
jgi:hypothetical protein